MISSKNNRLMLAFLIALCTTLAFAQGCTTQPKKEDKTTMLNEVKGDQSKMPQSIKDGIARQQADVARLRAGMATRDASGGANNSGTNGSGSNQ